MMSLNVIGIPDPTDAPWADSPPPVTPRTPALNSSTTTTSIEQLATEQNADPSRKRSTSSISVDPRHKRKVTRACDICKSKKAKCSGTQPCESCARRRFTCTYDARYSRGKPPTPPPMGSVQPIYPRDTTPRQLHSSRPSEASQAPSNVRTLMPLNSLADPATGQSGREGRYAPEYSPNSQTYQRPISSGPELQSPSTNMNLMGSLPRATPGRDLQSSLQPPPRIESNHDLPSRASPELEVAGQYSDSTSGLSFLHRAWARLSDNKDTHILGGPLGSSEDNRLLMTAGDKPFQDQGDVKIPPLSRSRELLIMYFDVCIATYRMIHRPTVEKWLEIVVQNAEARDTYPERPLYAGLSRPKVAIVLSVLAIATFHEEKARGGAIGASQFSPVNGEPSLRQCDGLFCEAARLTTGERGFPKLESAQCRLIQVLYLLMSSRMNQAWYTFGHALQIISALGLHRRQNRKRLPPQQEGDYIEEQCRKRTFWSAYTIDKHLRVIFGRPRHYHDDDIDQDFPDSVNDEDMTPTGPRSDGAEDCHIDSLIYNAKLAQILEKISREVYSIKSIPDRERIAASHRLGYELRQWKASLPPLLGAINPSSLITSYRRQATALKLSYCHAVMLTHRPFLLKNVTRDRVEIRELAEGSINECITAAQSVLEIVDRMAREGRLFHAFWWTHYVCFCALVVTYVWAIQQSNDGSIYDSPIYAKFFDQAERCLTHLAQATATNSPSRRYSIILQELRAEAKRKTAKTPPNIATSSVVGPGISNQLASFHNGPPTSGAAGGPDQSLFASPIDHTTSDIPNFLDHWRTTDWLDLDSSAFGPFPAFDTNSLAWYETDQ